MEHLIEVNGLKINVLEEGSGEAVLFFHGWPTSSYLWRHAVTAVGANRRAVALDLPGFGKSDKPLDASYSAQWYAEVLDGALDELGVEKTGIAVHDLGGPIGLWWAVKNRERVTQLSFLNTIVFSDFGLAVKLFLLASALPGVRGYMSSRGGLERTMRLGVRDKSRLTDEVMEAYTSPFADGASRQALMKAARGITPAALKEIEAGIDSFEVPVQLLYGTRDFVLPEVGDTMSRLKAAFPHADLKRLEGRGHFVQEDAPDEVAAELARFFA